MEIVQAKSNNLKNNNRSVNPGKVEEVGKLSNAACGGASLAWS